VKIHKTVVIDRDLAERLENHDNQSEVVREALREYLEVDE